MTEQPSAQNQMEYRQWRTNLRTQFSKVKQFLFADEYREKFLAFDVLLEEVDELAEAHIQEEQETETTE